MEGDTIEFNKINEALTHFGMGNLTDENLCKAYGKTDNGNRVWLPMLYKNKSHINIVHDDNGVKYILQIDIKQTEGEPSIESHHVFGRKSSVKHNYNFEDMGEYKHVLVDKNRHFTVHRKLPFTSGTLQEDPKGFYWDDKLFPSSTEAQKKADELFKIAEEKAKKQQ